MEIEEIKKKKSIQELLEFGVININKPSGPTSFDVSDFVRKKLNLRKTSHFGTLDPKVTGVLPIALNRACKLTGYFLGEDKEYVGVMRIHEDISLKEIEKIIKKKFIGEITQLPPVKSRVKRQERQREIKRFELLEIGENKKDILFNVECEGGTYIRKLIDDLGKELEIGAHMLELRRIRAGIFTEEDKIYPSINLYDLEKTAKEYEEGDEESLRKIIIPAEVIIELHQRVDVKKDNVKQILTGKPIQNTDVINTKNLQENFGTTKSQTVLTHRRRGKDFVVKQKLKTGEIVCIFSDNRFIGMYKVVNDKDVFAKAEFVMQEIKN